MSYDDMDKRTKSHLGVWVGDDVKDHFQKVAEKLDKSLSETVDFVLQKQMEEDIADGVLEDDDGGQDE